MQDNNNMQNHDDRWSKGKIRQMRGLMVFAALLVLALIYSKNLYNGGLLLLEMFKPFLYGGAIAFVLNLPMKWMEVKLLGRWRGKTAAKMKRPISIVGAIVFLVLIITVVIRTVIPQLTEAMAKLGNAIPAFLQRTAVLLQNYSEQYPELKNQAEQLQNLEVNWQDIVGKVAGFLKTGVSSMLVSTFSVAGNIIGGVVNFLIAFVFAIYILSQKEKLANQGTRILTAYLPPRASKQALKVFSLLHKNFSNFITGQCLEAVILGLLFVIAMTIFGMPYAVMVGVLIAFTALIPVVGAFIGCAVGAFLILLDNPVMALWFVVLFLIIQQIEGNLIYPKVVGNSVGLPSIWVLMAVSLGGSLFGVVGMLFFIPLLATAYSLLRESVNKRNGVVVSEVRMQQSPKEQNVQKAVVQATKSQKRNRKKPVK